ncbi:MAG: phosphatidylserine decarboxylase [Elusimicrobia bacterium]|nr:phosphatidylserine decarboxylase [Elusimicrobiota bacterium]
MVSKEVFPVAIPVASIFFASFFPLFFQPKPVYSHWNFYLACLSGICFLWILWFFRDPEIDIKKNDKIFLSPASGRVLEVEKTQKNTVRIFMNIFDYHIQRSPVCGKIKEIKYTSGKFLSAFLPDAHEKNERNKIVIESQSGEIEILQIAGSIARRIICWKKEGDEVLQGEKIGMIKFGSQVDCTFPLNYEVLVKKGEKVFCAKTPIARLKE